MVIILQLDVCRQPLRQLLVLVLLLLLVGSCSSLTTHPSPLSTTSSTTTLTKKSSLPPAKPPACCFHDDTTTVSFEDLERPRSRRGFLLQGLTVTIAASSIAVLPSWSLGFEQDKDPLTQDQVQAKQATVSSADVTSRTASSAPATEVVVEVVNNNDSSGDVVVERVDWSTIFQKASKKALGGGRAGASAAVVQVLSLMWLRTIMNYQYRYGGSLSEALQTLWSQGGIPRLYQGLPFALIQGPFTRFGDTAANVGILALLDSVGSPLPLPLKTACASVTAGLWRIALMPIDASKTAMQVEGAQGLDKLWQAVSDSGPSVLYRGALAQVAATAVGHFPWFVTYNFLNEQLPTHPDNDLLFSLVRSAGMGLVASCVSDTTSNSLRVIKTTAQTAQLTVGEGKEDLSYPQVVSLIVERDGVAGLFGRGLQTRLLTNAIQGALFSVLWKYFQQVQQ